MPAKGKPSSQGRIKPRSPQNAGPSPWPRWRRIAQTVVLYVLIASPVVALLLWLPLLWSAFGLSLYLLLLGSLSVALTIALWRSRVGDKLRAAAAAATTTPSWAARIRSADAPWVFAAYSAVAYPSQYLRPIAAISPSWLSTAAAAVSGCAPWAAATSAAAGGAYAPALLGDVAADVHGGVNATAEFAQAATVDFTPYAALFVALRDATPGLPQDPAATITAVYGVLSGALPWPTFAQAHPTIAALVSPSVLVLWVQVVVLLIALDIALLSGAYLLHVKTDRKWKADTNRSVWFSRNCGLSLLREYLESECFFDPAEVDASIPRPNGLGKDDLIFMDGYWKSEHHAAVHKSPATTTPEGKALGAEALLSSPFTKTKVKKEATMETANAEAAAWLGKHCFVDDGHTNYLLGVHPHGLFSMCVWAFFCSMGAATSVWHRVFLGRGWRVTQHTLDMNFHLPLWREMLMWLGACDVSRKALMFAMTRLPLPASSKAAPTSSTKHSVSQREAAVYDSYSSADTDAARKSQHRPVAALPTKGTKQPRLAMLVPGGAAESVDCGNHAMLTLKKRKGFLRLALATGASVLPGYTFGENYTYENVVSSPAVFRFLRGLQKAIGLGVPPVVGRSWYGMPLLPKRVPVTLVLGNPLSRADLLGGVAPPAGVPMAPTPEQVDHAHAVYVATLERLYSRNQPRFDPAGPAALVLK